MNLFKSKAPRDFVNWISTVNRITEGILMNEEIDITTEIILNTIKEDLNCFGAVYMELDEEHRILRPVSFTRSKIIKKVLEWVSGDIFKGYYKIHKRKNAPFIVRAFTERKLIHSNLLSDFFHPNDAEIKLFDIKTLNRIQKFLRLKLGIALPVQIQGQAFGVLFVASRKEDLSTEEEKLLQFYAQLAGIALDHNRKLKRLRDQYEAERETTSLMTHELKTPIAISSNTVWKLGDFLEKRKDELGELAIPLNHLYQEIKSGVDRLNFTCNSILNLNEIEQGLSKTLQVLNLEDQLEQVLNNAESEAKAKGLDFKVSMKLSKKPLYGPAIQFEQILTILLDNASKYTSSGSIHVKIHLTQSHLSCEVIDTGTGILKKEIPHIFKRFYRAKQHSADYKGLGIGLYMVKKILDQFHGSIVVSKNPKTQGSVFHVEIPVSKKAQN